MQADKAHKAVIILDFGSQYTQLIARRVRQLAVYCEILPYGTPLTEIMHKNPGALILSGGPASVYDENAPTLDAEILQLDLPILGLKSLEIKASSGLLAMSPLLASRQLWVPMYPPGPA